RAASRTRRRTPVARRATSRRSHLRRVMPSASPQSTQRRAGVRSRKARADARAKWQRTINMAQENGEATGIFALLTGCIAGVRAVSERTESVGGFPNQLVSD